MSASTPDWTPLTYGNWRVPRGLGIGRLSGMQSLVLFAALFVPLLLFFFDARLALIPAVVSVLLIVAVVVPVGGQTVADMVLRRIRFARARSAGWTELSGGILTDHPRRHDLPGPMGRLVPVSCDDGRGGKHGLLWDRSTGWLTAVIRLSPVGLDLADHRQADAWVASWGGFLADLGFQPTVRHIAVTVETAPSGGATLRDYVTSRIDPNAPEAARAVMLELVESTPLTAADVDTRVAITFDPSRATPRPPDLLAAAAEITRWLPGLEASLAMSGVAILGRASVDWLIGRLRVAYDPASRAEVGRLRYDADHSEVLLWSEAGPVRASETWDWWRHDSGISMSWAMAAAPRQAVVDRVLIPLLAPGAFPRRVSLLYRPYPAGVAADEVEREITGLSVRSAWSRRTRRDATQREHDDMARAQQSAREEAQGAGVGTFTFYVTTTVSREDQLPAAAADTEQRAGQAKLRLRRMQGAHAATFAASLGFGFDPAELAHRPLR